MTPSANPLVIRKRMKISPVIDLEFSFLETEILKSYINGLRYPEVRFNTLIAPR